MSSVLKKADKLILSLSLSLSLRHAMLRPHNIYIQKSQMQMLYRL